MSHGELVAASTEGSTRPGQARRACPRGSAGEAMSTQTLERPTEAALDTRETYHLVIHGDIAICGCKVRGLPPRRGDQL